MLKYREIYDNYVVTYRDENGKLPPLMELKYEHTMHVLENAEYIAKSENFSAEEQSVSSIAALFHDIGRYEQLKRYNTFRDADSIDHAKLSHDIVKENGYLTSLSQNFQTAILEAILYHSRLAIPDGLSPLSLTATKTVRDADKLDIFRVLENQIATTNWREDARAFWNLPISLPPNKAVTDAVYSHRPVDYRDIKSLSDFVLIQVGWIYSGLEYTSSHSLAISRGHLEFRRSFIKEICGYDIH